MGLHTLLIIILICIVAKFVGQAQDRSTKSRGTPSTVVLRPGKPQQPVVRQRTPIHVYFFPKRALICALPLFVAILQSDFVSGVSTGGGDSSTGGRAGNRPEILGEHEEADGEGGGVFSALSGLLMQHASRHLYSATEEGRSVDAGGSSSPLEQPSTFQAVVNEASSSTSTSTSSHSSEVRVQMNSPVCRVFLIRRLTGLFVAGCEKMMLCVGVYHILPRTESSEKH